MRRQKYDEDLAKKRLERAKKRKARRAAKRDDKGLGRIKPINLDSAPEREEDE